MSFPSFKCGEIFCIAPAVLNVTCSLCGDKINLDSFLRHYQLSHFFFPTLAEESINLVDLERKRKEKLEKNATLVDNSAIKEEDPAEDPFKKEDLAKDANCSNNNVGHDDEDKKCLQQLINEKKSVRQKTKADGNIIVEPNKRRTRNCKKSPQKQSLTPEENEIDNADMMEAADNLSNDETWKNEDEENDSDWNITEDKKEKTAKTKHDEEDEPQHSCQFCGRKYRIKKSLSKHINMLHKDLVKSTRKNTYNHECDKCDAKFRIARDLQAHLRKHNGITCDICGKSFTEIAHLARHKIRHTDKKEHKCKECPKEFFTAKELRSHMLCHTGDRPSIASRNCKRSPQEESSIPAISQRDEHESDNAGMIKAGDGLSNDKRWNNEDEENDSDWNMTQNQKDQTAENADDEPKHSCPFCGRKYRIKKSMSKHIHMLHRDLVQTKRKNTYNHECDQCDAKFRIARDLEAHLRIHNGITCNICGKSFTQIGQLARHKIRHTGIKEHKCKECPKEFFTAKELRSHMLCHTGLMPVICEICGKTCREKAKLTAHMRRHTGERPAKCDVCGKCFFSFHDLKVHKVTHTSLRPFKCDICNSTFQTKKAVRKHSMTHSKDRKHVCAICGKGFLQSNGLKSHMLSHDAAFISTMALETSNNTTDVLESPSSDISTANISAGTEIIINVGGVQIVGQYVV